MPHTAVLRLRVLTLGAEEPHRRRFARWMLCYSCWACWFCAQNVPAAGSALTCLPPRRTSFGCIYVGAHGRFSCALPLRFYRTLVARFSAYYLHLPPPRVAYGRRTRARYCLQHTHAHLPFGFSTYTVTAAPADYLPRNLAALDAGGRRCRQLLLLQHIRKAVRAAGVHTHNELPSSSCIAGLDSNGLGANT